MTSCRRTAVLALSLSFVSIFSSEATPAGWRSNGAPICVAVNDQRHPAAERDGAGGVIVAWQDNRLGGTKWQVYAQRLDPAGAPQWTPDGVPLCTAQGNQRFPAIVSDGAGGAIVAWQDDRNTNQDIYAQRVNGAGALQWGGDGVALCIADSTQGNPTISTDASNGAIVVWQDRRSGNEDLYARRVSAAGAPQWAANGVVVCAAARDQVDQRVVADAAGNALVVWEDSRAGLFSDIYAQCMGVTGTVLWTADGVALCTAFGNKLDPAIVADGAGGGIATWYDSRGASDDIYAQRVSAVGLPQWAPDGVAVCSDPANQEFPAIVSDGGSGAIVAWDDQRNGNFDIYAQRMSALGVPQWTADGVALCTALAGQFNPDAVSDGAGGAVVSWDDHRNGTDYDVFARLVDNAGAPQWTADGVSVSTASGDQFSTVLVPDDANGAIVVWEDLRNGDYDLFGARVLAGGVVRALISLASASATPERVVVTWFASGAPGLSATVYRESPGGAWVALGAVQPQGNSTIVYEDRDVTPGERYGYRLGIMEGGREEFFGEAWVEVPSGAALALQGLRPNPAERDIVASFSLAGDQPATLDLLDLAGRRVLSRQVGSLGAGNHRVKLGESRLLPAGLYLVRLTADGRSLLAKATVLR